MNVIPDKFIAYEAIPEIAAIITGGDEHIANEINTCLVDYADYFEQHRKMYADWDITPIAGSERKAICWICMLANLAASSYIAEVQDGMNILEIQTAMDSMLELHGLSGVLNKIEWKKNRYPENGEPLTSGQLVSNTNATLWQIKEVLLKEKIILCEIQYRNDQHHLFLLSEIRVKSFEALQTKYKFMFVLFQNFGATASIRNNLQMKDPDSFEEKINDLTKKYDNRDLEEYLRALYGIVLREKTHYMTEELFFSMLAEAYTAAPIPFDNAWLAHTMSPDQNALSRKFTNPEVRDLVDHSVSDGIDSIDFTIAVLEFQIAELHRMRGKQLEYVERYGGIDSETGHRWYNFDPHTNLSCGASGLGDLEYEENEEDVFNYTWGLIGELLETGRVYE